MTQTTVNIGREGELEALDYLVARNYTHVFSNYRFRKGEIDLIMKDEAGTLVFVEVKKRKNDDYGYPEQWVDDKKLNLLMTTAEEYLYQTNWMGRIRFDIMAYSETSGWCHLQDVS